MTIRLLDQVVALLLIALGAYLVSQGLGYGFMQGTTPGAGYFPVLMGGVLIVLSIVNLLRSLGGLERLKSDMTRGDIVRFGGVVVAMLAFVAITPWLGMTVATMLLMLAISLIIRPSLEGRYLVRVGVTAVVVPVVCKLLFATLLRVPVPVGVLGF